MKVEAAAERTRTVRWQTEARNMKKETEENAGADWYFLSIESVLLRLHERSMLVNMHLYTRVPI